MISPEISRWCHGSPVHRYGLYALQWIVEVNGKPTPDLDAFVDVTKVCFCRGFTQDMLKNYSRFFVFVFYFLFIGSFCNRLL